MDKGKGQFSKYPKHVGFILGNEFCERFSFYGMKAILVIFLTRALKLSEDKSTEIYHGFNMACYFTPLFGALIADGFLGLYKTIFSISIVYAIGNVIMAVGAVPFDGEDYIRTLPYVGLTLIAIGTGGIKPCVAAFGADQFADHQVRQKETFFSLFYMAINIGSLMSMIITPLIRSNVTCFGDECYALAFGIPSLLMIVAMVLFVVGTRWYTVKPPGDNVIGNMGGCLYVALKGKLSCSNTEGSREHWLDYADSKYDKAFISDIKAVLHVLLIFVPFPMFNALFDQQGSRWTLQAGRLNGNLGGFVLEPDLVQVANPVMVVLLVPFMESFLFPCMKKLKIPDSPLLRMGVGMFLAGTAFIFSGMLQIAIDRDLPQSPTSGHARIKILNALPCHISGRILDDRNITMYNFSISFDEPVKLKASTYSFNAIAKHCTSDKTSHETFIQETFSVEDQDQYNMITFWDKAAGTAKLAQVEQKIKQRTENGQASFVFFNTWEEDVQIEVDMVDDPIEAIQQNVTDVVKVPQEQRLKVNQGNTTLNYLSSFAGGGYTVVLHYNTLDAKKNFTQFEDVTPNSVNILFMLPQYFVMTIGEVFFMVTGLAFAYSQAPPSMKSVLQAAWLLTTSFGNLIVMVITAIGQLPNQMAEFFMYAGLMYLTTLLYAFIAMKYEYVSFSEVVPVDSDTDQDPVIKEDLRHSESNSATYDNLALSGIDLPPKYGDSVAQDRIVTARF